MSKQSKLLGTDDHGAPSPARARSATASSKNSAEKQHKFTDERAAINAAASAPTPNVPLGNRKEKLIAEGFLKKKSPKGLVKVWQARWFRLYEGSLQYFKSKESKEPNGVLPIFSIKYINPHRNKGKKPGRFDVVIGDNNSERIFALMATSDRSAETWVAVLQKVIAAYQKVAKEGTLTGNTVMNASHMDNKFWKDQQKVASLRAQNQSKLQEIDSKLAAQRAVAKKTVVIPSMEILKEEAPAAIGSVFTVRLRPTTDLDSKLDEQLKFGLHSIAKMDEGYAVALKLFEEMRKIDHQFIIQQVHYGEASDTLFAVYTPPLRSQDALISYLERHRRFPAEVVQFYAAQLIVAIGYLHSLQMTFRNLSPEFIFFAADGRLLLGDFLIALPAAQMPPECGEPEYTSPENKTTGDVLSSDWWRLGVLLYEISVGIPPFRSRLDGEEKVADIEQQVADFKPDALRFPPFVGEDLRDLIKRLLTLDPRKRLGAEEKDWEDIKSHHFFTGVNWEQIEAAADCEITVPEWVKLNVIERYAPLPIPANYSRGGVPRFEGALLVEAIAGRDIPGDRPSTYCSVRLNHESRGMVEMQDTKIIRRNNAPQWKSTMTFSLPTQAIDEPHSYTVVVEVIKADEDSVPKRKKDDKNASPLIGSVVTSLHNVKHWFPEAMDSWQSIIDHKGLPLGEIHMSYTWQQHRVKSKRIAPELCLLPMSLFEFFGRPTPRPSISGFNRDDSMNSHSRKDSTSGESSYNSSHSHISTSATPSSSINSVPSLSSLSEAGGGGGLSSSSSLTAIGEDAPPPPMTPSSAAVAAIMSMTTPTLISDDETDFPPPPPVAQTNNPSPHPEASNASNANNANAIAMARATSMVVETTNITQHFDGRDKSHSIQTPNSATIGGDETTNHEDEEASDHEDEDMHVAEHSMPPSPAGSLVMQSVLVSTEAKHDAAALAAEATAARENRERLEMERLLLQRQQQAEASEHARLDAEQRAAAALEAQHAAERKAAHAAQAGAEERELLKAQLEAELRAQVEKEIRQKAEEEIRKAELEMRARMERESAAREAAAREAALLNSPPPAATQQHFPPPPLIPSPSNNAANIELDLPPPPLATATDNQSSSLSDLAPPPTTTTTTTTTPVAAAEEDWTPPPPPPAVAVSVTVTGPIVTQPAIPTAAAIPTAKPSSRSPSPSNANANGPPTAAAHPAVSPAKRSSNSPADKSSAAVAAVKSPAAATTANTSRPPTAPTKSAATSATTATPAVTKSLSPSPSPHAAVGAPPPPPAFLVNAAAGGPPRTAAPAKEREPAATTPAPSSTQANLAAQTAAAKAAKDKAAKAKADAEAKKQADEREAVAAAQEAEKLKLDLEEKQALEAARQERLKTEAAVREEAKRKAKEAADKAEKERKRQQEEQAKAEEEARKKTAEADGPEGDGMCKDPKCDCGPDMFSPDPFKKGKCATCFHEHNPQPATRKHRVARAPAKGASAKSPTAAPTAATKGGAASAAAKGIAGGCLECMCGPSKFSVNPFKKNGCNTCFHEHLPMPGPGAAATTAPPAAAKSALVTAATAVIPHSAPVAVAPAAVASTPPPVHSGPPPCGTCGCSKYEKDPFKDRCSACFHKH